MSQIIHLHPAAPDKPAEHAPCNGCGVCCASEPCPMGILVSRKRKGACAALVWNDQTRQYRCGLIETPRRYLAPGLRWLAPALKRLAHRYISAGSGCDCSLVVERRGAASRTSG
ncbi:MAG TPA: hypothetical protein VN066_04390 [Rhodocyclaceae bacterium]|nr:hypothetical protein [Rhodocyclaceae bacterium]